MPTSFTNQQLVPHFHTLLMGDLAAPASPELHVIAAHIHALPAAEYAVFDPQAGDQLPPGIYGLGGVVTASWANTEQGYGDVTLLATREGPGLLISVGGSPLSSAASVWVVPVGLMGWVE